MNVNDVLTDPKKLVAQELKGDVLCNLIPLIYLDLLLLPLC